MNAGRALEILEHLDGHMVWKSDFADECCDVFGVPRVKPDVVWTSVADAHEQGMAVVDVPMYIAGAGVWSLRLLEHLCQSLKIDWHTMYIGRGRVARELVARLQKYVAEQVPCPPGECPADCPNLVECNAAGLPAQ